MFHITQAKRKLKELIQTALPLMLARADGESGDGVSTTLPISIFTTEKNDLGELPALEIIVTDSTPQGEPAYAQIYRHRVVVGVSVGGDDEETIAVMVERYIWALRQVFRNVALVPIEGTGPVDTGGEQYTPLQQRPETVENPFVKGAFLEVFITTVE